MTTHPATPDQSKPVGKAPEALRLAEALADYAKALPAYGFTTKPLDEAAAELRRQHAALSAAAPAVARAELCPSCRNGDLYACTCPFPTTRNTDSTAGVPDTDLTALFREALAWGMAYGPAIPAHQWDEMRDTQAALLSARARGVVPRAAEVGVTKTADFKFHPSISVGLMDRLQKQPVGATVRLYSDTAAPMSAQGVSFQQRVQPWMMECFGPMIAGDREERNHRFIEEALELVQSTGCSASEAHQLVDYVFGRPVGEPAQEVGGVMVTLAALCLANGLDMHTAAETELSRIWTKVEAIRAKQAAKPKHSPLPMAAAPGSGLEQDAPASIELTDDVRFILGFICFQCMHIVQALRLGGHEIRNKAEFEQAAAIHFMLNHYLADRENWRENVNAELRAMAAKGQDGGA